MSTISSGLLLYFSLLAFLASYPFLIWFVYQHSHRMRETYHHLWDLRFCLGIFLIFGRSASVGKSPSTWCTSVAGNFLYYLVILCPLNIYHHISGNDFVIIIFLRENIQFAPPLFFPPQRLQPLFTNPTSTQFFRLSLRILQSPQSRLAGFGGSSKAYFPEVNQEFKFGIGIGVWPFQVEIYQANGSASCEMSTNFFVRICPHWSFLFLSQLLSSPSKSSLK